MDYFPENRDLVSEQQIETSFKLMKGWKDHGHWNGWRFLLGVALGKCKISGWEKPDIAVLLRGTTTTKIYINL